MKETRAVTLYTRAKHTVARRRRAAFRRVRRWNRTVIRMIYTRLESYFGVARPPLPSSKHAYLLNSRCWPLVFAVIRMGVDSSRSILVRFFFIRLLQSDLPSLRWVCTYIFSRCNNKNYTNLFLSSKHAYLFNSRGALPGRMGVDFSRSILVRPFLIRGCFHIRRCIKRLTFSLVMYIYFLTM